MGTRGYVGEVLAFAFVHGIVVDESHLIASELALGIGREEQVGSHGAAPKACFQHAPTVVLARGDIGFVGGAEDKGAVSAVGYVVELTYERVVVEPQLLVGVVDNHGDVVEAATCNLFIAEVGGVVNHHLEVFLGCKPKLQAVSVDTVAEDRHVNGCSIGLDHHVEREVFVREVALCLGFGIALLFKLQRGFLLDVALVGFAHHLEVGDAAEVVRLDVLREVEDDVVAGIEDAVLGLWRVEELRAAGVLDATEHLR